MAFDRNGSLLPLLIPAAFVSIVAGIAALAVSCSVFFGGSAPIATPTSAIAANPSIEAPLAGSPGQPQPIPSPNNSDASSPDTPGSVAPGLITLVPTPTPYNVLVSRSQQVYVYNPTPRTAVPSDAIRPTALTAFPKPTKDNGRGLHWFPTRQQSKAVIDAFLPELDAMGVRWVVILQGIEPYDATANEYLVGRLLERGMMPIMRIDRQVGDMDLNALARVVAFYRARGVRYFQIFNEPNEGSDEWGSDGPQTPEEMVKFWIPAARTVLANGGYPGFPPMQPIPGDCEYVTAGLAQLKQDKQFDLINAMWLSVHNYGGLDASGFWRYRQYNAIVHQVFGVSLPLIGTEGGAGSADENAKVIRPMFLFMTTQREPYFFAYSPWLIGNAVGGGQDPRWEQAAWYDGTLTKLHPKAVADIVKSLMSGG